VCSSPPFSRAATRSTPIAGGRLTHLLVGGLGLREADVVGNRPREEERILQHDAELTAVRAQLDLAQVVPVDPHRAAVGVVEARDELRQRRLAAAGLADERDAATLGHVQVDVVQDVLRAVGEADVIEIDTPVDAAELAGALRVPDLRLGVEDRADLDHRRRRGLQLPVHIRELLQRLEDQLHDEQRGDQRSDLDRAAREQLGTDDQNRGGRDIAHQLDRREEDREELLHSNVRCAVGGVQLVELLLERALAVERLDHCHARHRLGQLRRDPGDPLAHGQQRRVRRDLEPAGQDQRRRQDPHRH